jgi:hypothetical protein
VAQVNQSSNATVKNNAENTTASPIYVGAISGGNNQLGSGNTMIVTNPAGAVFDADLVFNRDFVVKTQGGRFTVDGTFRLKSLYPVTTIYIGAKGADSISFWPKDKGGVFNVNDGHNAGYAVHGLGIAPPGDYKYSIISTTMPIGVIYDIR